MLLFKKKFLPAIRSGDKTQTIRLWKWRMMRAGQRSYIPGVGPIRIDGVEEVALDRLTDADAVPDGFATAAELQHELATIYGDKLAAGYKAFRVTFRTVEEGTGGQEDNGPMGQAANRTGEDPCRNLQPRR